jgi:alpha-ketoglutarate-dependent taurine dioxygenase
MSNWNYFQIYKEYNDEYTMSIRENYSNFLNKNITEGRISTISKNWKKGDCVIFNDHFVMHERSSFYGSRHLKDMHFMDKNIRLD